MDDKDFTWEVSSTQKGMRLHGFLEKMITESGGSVSKKQMKKAVDSGFVKVNGSIETFSSCRLNEKDQVVLWHQWKKFICSHKFALSILYEDQDCWVIDKPSGLEVSKESLDPLFEDPFFLVHRLDKGTSGAMIVAKTKQMEEMLIKLFAGRDVKKKYLALVDGHVKKEQGFIQKSLAKRKSYDGQTLWGITDKKGLSASTHWSLLKKDRKKISLLLCQPITGRTHQIRVHLSSIGHPILGDYQYCKRFSFSSFMPRLMLHSYQVSFTHPLMKKTVSVCSPYPEIFDQIIGPLPEEGRRE